MSDDRWVLESKQLLEKLAEMESAQEGDRLNSVGSMLFSLKTIERTLAGWLQWTVNPHMMVRFSAEELKEMEAKLRKYAKSFLEYDIEVTERSPTTTEARERPRTSFEV